MSLLLITLPPSASGPYPWVTSVDGQRVSAHGVAAPALLPAAGRGVEVLALVAAAQLSWHRISLPKNLGRQSARLRAALTGLLEEQLLDDPDALHFALGPAIPGTAQRWVAVCHRAWLAAHLQALEAAGRGVSRVVPELTPAAAAAAPATDGDGGAAAASSFTLTLVGEPDHGQILLTGAAISGGVQVLPLSHASLPLLPAGALHGDAATAPAETRFTVYAEPAVAQAGEQLLRHPVRLQSAAERALAASRTDWDLAQLEFAQSGHARSARRLASLWREMRHAPQWRAARVGLLLLAAINLAGLNLWAWQTRADLRQRQTQINHLLQDTFPSVKLVVDAPLQMERQVAALRQATGAASPGDLEALLAALGTVTGGADNAPAAIEYASGQMQARGVRASASALAEWNARLAPLGYRLTAEENGVRLQAEAAP
ncbi:MAG: general secretion pathway protein GspL [Burkholderiaceae bacterium]|jgi:general secretion pathway protein L|nr:general secretion pathway protein GspL [Burkholderiaceae bacterium]